MKNKPWGAFLYRDYRILWIILVCGSIVVWMRILSTAQWLLDETGSAFLVGLIGVVQLFVQIPATLWAGTLADRVDRKHLITLGHGIAGITLLSLGLLDSQGLLTPIIMYAGIAITAGAHMLTSPARSTLVPIIIPQEQITSRSIDGHSFTKWCSYRRTAAFRDYRISRKSNCRICAKR